MNAFTKIAGACGLIQFGMAVSLAQAASPAEIRIPGERVVPESLTSDGEGHIYIGSIGARTIYRVLPGGDAAEPWIAAETEGMQNILGVFADDASKTLWACSNGNPATPGGPPNPPATLYAFDLKTAKLKGKYPFPTAGASCNDIAVGADGTAYATDTPNMQVVRLKPSGKKLEQWSVEGAFGPKGGVLDGICVLGSTVHVNTLATGKLFSVPIEADGKAGAVAEVKLDRALERPDGMRSYGKDRILIAEQGGPGRVSRIDFANGAGKLTTLKEGYPDNPVAITVVGEVGYVLEAQFRARRPDPAYTPKPFHATVVDVNLVQKLSSDPFEAPLESTQGVVAVNFVEFAKIPAAAGGEAPRMMHMLDEPGTKRFFVSTMRGPLYSVSYNGKKVKPYLDVNDTKWGVGVQFSGSERGVQSFAFHPQFAQRGQPGYGKFYTYTDTTNVTATADYVSGGANRTHDTVLLEWTAKNPKKDAYDGGAPREVYRAAQPFPNHNGGQIAFNPLAKPGDPEFGLLYAGLADGGAGGDPMKLAQNLNSAFGKILRIDPLGSDSANKHYGIPASNPFVSDNKPETLGEIYAYGVRNPQRFTWDAKDGRMYLAEIGQNLVEEISPVTAGANLGWNIWEGSYRFVGRQVDLTNPRMGAGLTWPIVEFDHKDPLFQRTVAITGIAVYRDQAIPQLANAMIFGDNPSGEIFFIDADQQPSGGGKEIRRILLNDGGTQKTLLQLIRENNTAGKQEPATRADLRFGFGSRGQIFILNKHDGIIRQLVAAKS